MSFIIVCRCLNRSVFDRYNIVEERDDEEAARLYEQGAQRELASLAKAPGASAGSVPSASSTEQEQGVDNRRRPGVDR
jgi:hypothetical protein